MWVGDGPLRRFLRVMPKGWPQREPGLLLKMRREYFCEHMWPVMGFPYLLKRTWSLFLGQ